MNDLELRGNILCLSQKQFQLRVSVTLVAPAVVVRIHLEWVEGAGTVVIGVSNGVTVDVLVLQYVDGGDLGRARHNAVEEDHLVHVAAEPLQQRERLVVGRPR